MNRILTGGAAAAFSLIGILSCADATGPAAFTTDDLSADPNRILASIEVHLPSATIKVGQSVHATVSEYDRRGRPLDRPVKWRTSDSTIASVTDSGVVTGIAPGNVTITAKHRTIIGSAPLTVVSASDTTTDTIPPPPPPPPSGLADPTLLPLATGQHPVTGTYGRGLAANQTYTDPNTGVLVLKLTSASVPNANAGVYAGYSEGGPNISQPWVGTDGNTYYTAYISDGWLVDIRYDTFSSSNWRRVPIDGETNFAFSLNPATPRIGYYVDDGNDKTIHRYNTAANQNEDTGIFPFTTSAAGGSLTWLQVNMNDGWLVGMLNSNATVVAVRLADGLQRVIPAGGHDVDEPHIDREFPIVYISTNDQANIIINLETGAVVPETDPMHLDAADHEAPLRGRVVYINWTVNGIVSTDRDGNVKIAVTPSPTDWSGDWHMAGQWVFDNPNQYFVMDQWQRGGTYPIYLGMIGFVSLGGDIRILAAHDAKGGAYDTGGQPHPTLSPDGKLVMWTSNMNGSARFDIFVARVPVR